MTKRCKKETRLFPCPKKTNQLPKKTNSHFKNIPIPTSSSKIQILENIIKAERKKTANQIKNSITKEERKANVQDWKNKIAPQKEIMQDLISTIIKSPMSLIDKDMAYTFDIMAVEGRAENAHGTFESHYPNTTKTDVLNAITKADPAQLREYYAKTGIQKESKDLVNYLKENFTKIKFQNRVQGYIDSIVELQEDWLEGIEKNISTIDKYSDSIVFKNSKNGAPNKMSCLKGMEVNMLALLRGAYLTANMDTFRGIRDEGFKKYGKQTGGGEGYLINMKKLQEYGIDLNDLSKMNYRGALEPLNNMPHDKRLDILENLKIITRKSLPLEDIAQGEYTWEKIKTHPGTTNLQKNPGFEDQYIREEKGLGVGDDKVIFMCGFLPQEFYKDGHKRSGTETESGILGGLSSDFIDTVSKSSHIIMPGGQDYIAGLHLNGRWKKLAQDKRVRNRFGIRENPDGDYDLLTKDQLIAYTMAGANTIGKTLHSSQRHFFLDKPGETCMVSELLKLGYAHAMIRGIPMDLNNIRNFKINLGKNFDETKFTFESKPLREIKPMLNECLNLVDTPTQQQREDNLRKFYLPN